MPPHVRSVLDAARRLVVDRPDIVAIALVGSWARGTARPESDVDLVVLTPRPAGLLDDDDWYQLFGPSAALVRSADFGAIQERRLRVADGLEVEIGVGSPSWAGHDPVDPGTRRVLLDGVIPLHDPVHLLAGVIAAVGGPIAWRWCGGGHHLLLSTADALDSAGSGLGKRLSVDDDSTTQAGPPVDRDGPPNSDTQEK